MFGWLKGTFVKQCKEGKGEENRKIFRNTYISCNQFPSNLVCKIVVVMYIEDIKYVNLIEIGQVVIEIQRVENGKLVIPVDNTLVYHMALLAVDTKPCVLICT